MQKQLFLLMLGLSTMGGVAIHPTPAMALEAPAPNITVKGQVVDDMGEPLTGATIKVKGTATGTITTTTPARTTISADGRRTA